MCLRTLAVIGLCIVATLAPHPGYGQTACAVEDVACTNAPVDSQWNNGNPVRINSSTANPPPVYYQVISRYRFSIGPNSLVLVEPVTVDYMVHEPAAPLLGLVVLIAGGQLDANLQGTNGGPVSSAGGNFVVRSAHLFRDQGFRVLTIDRPSDWEDFLAQSGDAGYLFDGYRTSTAQFLDIKTAIAAHGTPNGRVFLAGTSRGAISVVAWNTIADGISLTSPVTSGDGTPIGSPGLTVSDINVPTCVHWHVCDACTVSTPLASQLLLNALTSAGLAAGGGGISGGFDNPGDDACQALTVHGFFGIESCAVDQVTQCLSSIRVVPPLRIDDYFFPEPVPGGQSIEFKLAPPGADRKELRFRLLRDRAFDSYGGRVHVTRDGRVRFVAPDVARPATAKFAFEVSDRNGRKTVAIAAVDIVPDPGTR